MRELVIEAEIDKLEQVQEFVRTSVEGKEYNKHALKQLELIVEEIFVNIASYAYGEEGGEVRIEVEIEEEPLQMELTFKDKGVAYNPLKEREPDVTLPIEERTIGGLGIYLTKQLADEISYEYNNKQNILRLTKTLD